MAGRGPDPIPDAPANPGRTMTLAGALKRLREFGPKTAQKIHKVMQNEVPIGKTGDLKSSLYWKQISFDTFFIGTDMYYAKWVENGRGPVRPVSAKALFYFDYKGGHKSVHKWGTDGLGVMTKRVGPSKKNPFVDRTKQKVEKMTFTL